MSISVARKIAFLVCLVVIPAGLRAQGFNPRLGIFSSGTIMKGDRDFVVNGSQFRSEFVNGGNVGMRGTIDLTDHWSLDATYGFGNNNLRVVENGTTTTSRAFGIRNHQITTSLLRFVNGRDHRVRVFVDGGLGLSRYSPTELAIAAASTQFVNGPATITTDNQFNFNVGGGLESRLAQHIGLRLAVRDLMTPVPRFGVPETSSGPGSAFFPVQGLTHNIEVSIGTVLYLTSSR
jgi:opacity protein-like surface antigen